MYNFKFNSSKNVVEYTPPNTKPVKLNHVKEINTKLPDKYCLPVKTPDKKLRDMAPYSYDTTNPKNQPTNLVAKKSVHNAISSNMYSDVQHPINMAANMLTLKLLKDEIDSYCKK